jgi:hypothetical protein
MNRARRQILLHVPTAAFQISSVRPTTPRLAKLALFFLTAQKYVTFTFEP